MRHLEDGNLHAIADGEVPSDELVAVREHLDTCESCRARLDEARMEAETARDLIELIEVPVGPTVRPSDGQTGGQAGKRAIGRWIRPLAWAASLVLAAGIGYMNRPDIDAVMSAPIEPTSLGRVDTVYLDVPAREAETRPADLNRRADPAPRPSQPANEELAASPPPATAQQNAAGARQERELAPKRRLGLDSTIRLNEVVVTGTAEKKSVDTREADAQVRPNAATSLRASRAAAPSSVPPVAEDRLMAKAAADADLVIVNFPRAVELLGGRIKLIEGMVPSRLEASGRVVRVIYVIDEGDLVLAEVAGSDSVNWSLSGPLSTDSLEALRRRVK